MTTRTIGFHAETNLSQSAVKFSTIIKSFKSSIEKCASHFPKSWRDDFIQEGEIALFRALQSVNSKATTAQIRAYANMAIRRAMIDFWRKTQKNSLIKEVSSTIEDDDEIEYIYNVTGDPEFFVTTTFDLDYSIIFNQENMTKMKFNKNDIAVFDYHLIKGYSITDTADKLHISVGQASKIATKVKEKAGELLAHYKQNEN